MRGSIQRKLNCELRTDHEAKTGHAGVTVVQYRDKTSDTGVLINTAKQLHQLTRRYNVPLLINDRVDVALAIGAEGVHLGQDDMSQCPAVIPAMPQYLTTSCSI